jgi:hypothetical protein
MIDTLKLSKRLQEADLPKNQAEAIAEGLAESIRESLVTNEKLSSELAKLKADLIIWFVGTVGLGTIISHYWK